MPRLPVPGFVGPTNVLRVSNQDVEETINRYIETTAPGSGKVAKGLLPCPGVVPVAKVNDQPGATIFYQDGRCFGVTGTSFWELLAPSFNTVVWGLVANPTAVLPASIVSNGTAGGQLLICSGGQGYVFTLATNAFTVINTSTFPGTAFPVGTAQQVEFMDGYGIVLVAMSREFFISALEDFTTWNALDVGQRSEGSDNIQTMRRNHRELWFLGTKTGEVWYDSGAALFPFAPVPGTFVEYGSASVSSCRVNGTIAWIGLGERGIGVLNLADGYNPQAISTRAIEHYLNQSQQLTAAKLFAQQQDGHIFLWILVPDLDTTPVYDYTEGVWHKRALWDPDDGQYVPHLASAHAFIFPGTPQQMHVVLDRQSGNIYQLSLGAFTDTIAS